MKRKVHVVPHTHWDREWYFNTSRSKVYLMKDLQDVMDTLEKNTEFKYFMLDAQASLLDDYLKWNPKDESRIKKLVKEKRLIIGPWYTQSDQMVISAESIVRNLYYGMKRCEELGGYMNVAYVPDSFGQAGNMPQIYRGFGMEDTLFWRGVSDDMVKKTDYIWKGDDGSKVFTTQIPFGYYIGGNISEGKTSKDFWKRECFEKAGKRSSTKHIYFPNGFDQAPIRYNLPEILKERSKQDPDNEYVISCIEDYIKDVKSENPDLEEVSGELLNAKHMRIHKTIFSSRSDLKVLNTEVQNYVTNIMEPLLTISSHMSNPYPHDAVAEIWKLLFENAAHDSIGSCISDSANEDVYMRYKQALDIAINLVELHSRLIATSIKDTSKQPLTFTLFNTLPNKRDEVVLAKVYLPSEDFSIKDHNGNTLDYIMMEQRDLTEYILAQTIRLNPDREIYIPEKIVETTIAIKVENIPALGYKQLYAQMNENSRLEMKNCDFVENEYYRISCNENGTLNITDKLLNHTYKDQLELVDNGDDGDSFNYSPPRTDYKVSSKLSKASYRMESCEIISKIYIKYDMEIPYDLEQRAKQVTTVRLPINIEVTLRKGSKVVEFNVNVKNNALSHRLCALFDTGIASTFNYADQQFGSIKRPNEYKEEMRLYTEGLSSKKEVKNMQNLANWANDQSAWQEPMIPIEPTQSYVSISSNEKGVALFPQGVREYEIVKDNDDTIALTLFRCYGFMGKENLVYRPGRASGERIIETPAAQLLKEMDFKFGAYYYQNDFTENNISNVAKSFNTPIEMYTYAEYLNGRLIFSQMPVEKDLPYETSLLETNGNFTISAIKKCEEQEGYIVRLYNGAYQKELDDQLICNFDVDSAYYTNLKEEIIEPISVMNNVVDLKALSHCKFVTVLVKKG